LNYLNYHSFFLWGTSYQQSVALDNLKNQD